MKQIIGLVLSGAKNTKSTLAMLDWYEREKKIFVRDVIHSVIPERGETNDQALLRLLRRPKKSRGVLAVDAPITLPPYFISKKRDKSRAIQWAEKNRSKKEFTPYTQRPLEIWLKNSVLTNFPPSSRFEIDETFGGNRAPIAARMAYLRTQLKNTDLIEVNPKLTLGVLARELKIRPRIMLRYRQLEQGRANRMEILQLLTDRLEIFVYDRDLKTMAEHLATFDAFIGALTGYFYLNENCVKPPKGYPISSGWINYPKSSMLD